jgi:uncharacterized protein
MNDRMRRCRDAALALMLAPMLALALPALSAAQSPAASEAAPQPAPASAPDHPNPDAAASGLPSATRPLPMPSRSVAWLALVLPLKSSTYGRAADALREGFAAAAAAAGVRFDVVAHGDGEVRAALDTAQAAGARVIVGPLVRDDVKAIADLGRDVPWIIALNQLDEGGPLPVRVYTLALAIDSEARQLARRAREDGAQSVVVIGGETALQKRFADAFVGEWILAGGGAPVTFRFDRAPEMLAVLRREFARIGPDAVVLAVDAPDAALAKPYLGTVAAYASSQVNDRQDRGELLELDNVTFVEIPWLADPAAAAFARIARREYPSANLDRLYALGVDAFRVAQAFAGGSPPEKLEFDGATGHLTLEASRQFAREATLLQFRTGQIVPASGPTAGSR